MEHLAGRHVIQVVCLSVIFICIFFVKIPGSVSRNTIYIYFPQVACGAYHSLALVRSLPPKNSNTQNPYEKRERGQSPHYSVAEREELFAVDGGHYCPLGVELTEVMTGEVNVLHACLRGPRFSALVDAPLWFAFPDFSKEKWSQTKAPTWGKVSWQ